MRRHLQLLAAASLFVAGCGLLGRSARPTARPARAAVTQSGPLVERELGLGVPSCDAPPCPIAENLPDAPRWTLTAWVYAEGEPGPVLSTPRWSLSLRGGSLGVRARGTEQDAVQVPYPDGWHAVVLVADGSRWRLCVDGTCREGPHPPEAGPGPTLSAGAPRGQGVRVARVRVVGDAVADPTAGPHPEPFEVPVFEATRQYCYRIPAVVAQGSTLRAFAERRHGYGRNRCSDHGDIDLVVRSSTDGGWTWGPERVVVDHGPLARGHHAAVGNASPVVDGDGALHLLYAVSRDLDGQGNDQGRVLQGDPNVERLAFAARVTFDGDVPRVDATDITDAIRGEGWRWFAFGPGHGIRLAHGRCAGRLVVPGYFSVARPGAHAFATVFVNDAGAECDGEAGWRTGGATQGPLGETSSESQVVERADGTLWLTSRRVRSDRDSTRRVAVSSDGGATWAPSTEDPTLVDPISHAAVVRSGDALVLAHPACRAGARPNDRLWQFRMRRWMTVSMSEDGGRTWPHRRVVREGSSAYPDLVDLGDGDLGLLYEAPMEGEPDAPVGVGDPGWYENGISFVRVDREWIRSGPRYVSCDEQRFASQQPGE